MKKLFITIALIAVGVAGFFIQDQLRENDDHGAITIELVDQNGDTFVSDTYTFQELDTLLGILEENYTTTCANASYQPSSCDESTLMGHILLGVDDLQTDWTNNYIAIYVNDEYSNYGIDNILLMQDAVYRFEYTEVGEE